MKMLKKIFGFREKSALALKKNSSYFDFFVAGASEVSVSISAEVKGYKGRGGDLRKAAVAHFEFYDEKGARVEVSDDDFSISSVVGMYKYLELSEEGVSTTSINLRVTENVKSIRLGVRGWDKNVSVSLIDKPRVKIIKNEILEIDAESSQKQVDLSVYEYKPVERERLRRKPKIFEIAVRSTDSDKKALIKIFSFIEPKFSESSRLKSSALVSFEYLDESRRILMPDEGLAISAAVGAYKYLEAKPGKVAETVVEISVPKKCAIIRVLLRSWTDEVDVYLKDEPYIDLIQQDDKEQISVNSQVQEIVNRAAAREGLVFLYTTAPLMGHTSLGLRPNRLAREYAKLGYSVVFFPFGKVKDNEIEYQENIFQFNREIISSVLEEAAKHKNMRVLFICSSFPDTAAIAAVDFSKSYGWKTLYEVRDEMEEFNRVGYSVWYRSRLEAYMCRRVDKVITVSPSLHDKMIVLGAKKENTLVIPNAVEQGFIKKAESLRNSRISNEAGKVGYIGHLTPSWFDWPWVIAAAKALPNVEFEIIGHGAPEGLALSSNIKILGPKTHDEFLEICKSWKVGLIPFKPSRLTRAVDPNKLFEYLAVGLSVVSSDMGSVNESPITYVYADKDDLIEKIKIALNQRVDENMLSRVESYISRATWQERAKSTLSWVFD
ncbi:hypothetical protein ACP6NF_06075 [Alcaligenes faecalis]|uniref:hypothetical protein n=1 Tax=Alcaligenes faecalis TaxID=511 RepID=UPI003F7C9002